MEPLSKHISNTVKGILLMIAGTILLLDTMGITMKVIHYSMFLGAIIMIMYGFVESGCYQKLVDMFKTQK